MSSSAVGRDDRPRSGIIVHNVVNMHREPARSAEMVSQTLLGHSVEVLDERDGWMRVQTEDTYRGWVESRWVGTQEAGFPPDGSLSVIAPFGEIRSAPYIESRLVLRVSLMTRLARRTAAGECPAGWLAVNGPADTARGFLPENAVSAHALGGGSPLPDVAVGHAFGLLGTPYVWGGTSSFGLDCSGFVQLCYRLAGIVLLRDADQQREDSRFVPVPFSDLSPGDLVFFGKEGRITHVGMWYGGTAFLHASGGAGVIVTEWGDDRYTPIYVDARRLDLRRRDEPVRRFEAENR